MTIAGSLERHWGTFINHAPLIQSYPGGKQNNEGRAVKQNIIYTRTWTFGVGDNGRPIRVPIISGDSMRGRMRRAIAHDLFTRVGVNPADLHVRTAHVFIAGGTLDANDLLSLDIAGAPPRSAAAQAAKATVRDDTAAELYVEELNSLLPPIAVFGGTVLGRYLPGSLSTSTFVAQTADTPAVCLHPSLRGEQQITLPAASGILMEQDFVCNARELADIYNAARLAGDYADTKSGAGPAITMPHAYQCVVPGVTFAGSVAIRPVLPTADGQKAVQAACVRHALDLAFPGGQTIILGLRGSQGYGYVEFDWDDIDAIAPNADAYLDHLDNHADQIRSLLHGNGLVPKIKPKANGTSREEAAADTDDGTKDTGAEPAKKPGRKAKTASAKAS